MAETYAGLLRRTLDEVGEACARDELTDAGERLRRYDAALRAAVDAGGLDAAALVEQQHGLQLLMAALLPRRDAAGRTLGELAHAGNAARAYLQDT